MRFIKLKNKLRPLIFILLIVTLVMPCSYSFADSKTRTAVVTSFAGDVDIMKSGGEKLYEVKKNMKLKHGDRIITGKDSWVMLDLDGDKEVKIGDKTYISLEELTFEDGEDTSLKVFKGKVWVNIKKKLDKEDEFEVKTPNSVMGARGTKFLVSYDEISSEAGTTENASKLTVIEGKVQAVSSAKVKVKDQNGNIVEKQLTIAVNVEEGEDVQLVLQKIEKELQNIANEVQALDETGQVDIADIQKVIESKISKDEMDAMNVKELKFDELDSFSIETIIQDIKNSGETDEKKDLLDNLNKVLDNVKKEEKLQETKLETLINQISSGITQINTNTGSSGGGGGTPAVVPPQPPQTSYSGISLLSANTYDHNEKGKVDIIKLIFSGNIDEDSIASQSGITITPNDGCTMGAITDMHVDEEHPTYLYIYLSENVGYNTNLSAKISISPGAIKSEGLDFVGVNNYSVSDNVAPVVLDWNLDLAGNDKVVEIILSELVHTGNGIEPAKLKITDKEEKTPIPLNILGCTGGEGSGGSYKLTMDLSHYLVDKIINLMPKDSNYCLIMDSQAICDQSCNYTYALNPLSCNQFDPDNTKPYITAVESTSDGAIVDISFNEFITNGGINITTTGSLSLQDITYFDKRIQLKFSNLNAEDYIDLSGATDLSGNKMQTQKIVYMNDTWSEYFGFESAYTYGYYGQITSMHLNFNRELETENVSQEAIISKITLQNIGDFGPIKSAYVSGKSVVLGFEPSAETKNSGVTGGVTIGEAMIFDSEGNANSPIEAQLIDKAKPTLVINDAVNDSDTFWIDFSEKMDIFTISEDNITVYGHEGVGTGINSIEDIGQNDDKFKIYLTNHAEVGDEIAFSTNIKDENGNGLHVTKIIRFNADNKWELKN